MKMEDKDRRNIFKMGTVLLLLLMVIRHSLFYFDSGNINTEMGYDQALIGIILIPVTASFGCLFFWQRLSIELKRRDIIKFLFIGLIPVILSFYFSDVKSILEYNIDDVSRRPPFLILLPIVMSIYLFFIFKKYIYIPLLILSLIYFVYPLFVLHYIIIFLLFVLLQKVPIIIKFQNSIYPIFVFSAMVAFILIFEVVRVDVISELIFAWTFLATIFCLCRFFTKHISTILSIKYLNSIGVLYFYIMQAILFTVISKFSGLSTLSQVILCMIIFGVSAFVSFYAKKLENYFYTIQFYKKQST